ncbi:unnamed protein product [Durusdinium trenchii]|uniref:MFS transporter n=1 Tax=Durusdinium trenchii TaxID=1381693 RepID=A0ABP0S471_9DINO
MSPAAASPPSRNLPGLPVEGPPNPGFGRRLARLGRENFFHGSAVSTWLGFACTFVARPFGGLVLGVVGDIFGRKASTFLSIFGMMVGTVGQGILPLLAVRIALFDRAKRGSV